jgi:hypothetical protein
VDLKCYKITEYFKRKNCSDPNLPDLHTFMGDLMERNKKEEDVERQVLAGQSNESWKDRALLLADFSPL